MSDDDRQELDAGWSDHFAVGLAHTPVPQGDVKYAAALVSWGLRPTARPAQHLEYRELVERYQQDAAFRTAVALVAQGGGLRVVHCGGHGLILAAGEDSPYFVKPADFRGNADVEGRMRDGLIQIAIAATVYPRAADFFEPPDLARPKFTVAQVQEILDVITDRLREATAEHSDPPANAEEQGLLEAWRVYDATPRVRETPDGRAANRTIRRQITLNLQRLRDQGFMLEDETGDRWRSTTRYHLQMQDYVESPVMDALRALKALAGDDTAAPDAARMP